MLPSLVDNIEQILFYFERDYDVLAENLGIAK